VLLQVLTPTAREALRGSILIAALPPPTDKWSDFRNTRWPSFNATFFNGHWPDVWEIPEGYFPENYTRPGPEYAPFIADEYDAVAAVGLLACMASPSRMPPRTGFGAQLYRHHQNVSFEGLSGNVQPARAEPAISRPPSSRSLHKPHAVTPPSLTTRLLTIS
jgi:hypothetical protein